MPSALDVRQSASDPMTAVLGALRQSFVFQSLSTEDLMPLAVQCHRLSFGRGHVLFQRDMLAPHAYIILSGWVKLYCETLDGAEGVYDIVSTGQLVGEQALFNNNTYPTGAMVVDDADVLQMPLAYLTNMLETLPAFTHAMLFAMAHRQRVQDMEIENRTLKTTPQRLGCFLLRLCPATVQTGAVTLHLPYDKMLLATRLGMQPETFSRALTKLKAETGLVVIGSTIQVPRVEHLRKSACSGCSGVFPCGSLRHIKGPLI